MKKEASIQKLLLSSRNARLLFIETFIAKLQERNATKAILETICNSNHNFKAHIKHIAGAMFNLFAKNMVSEFNDEIHKQRKRAGSPENEKRDFSCMKAKKLKSIS